MRKGKRRKRRKKKVVLLAMLLVFVSIIIVAVYQSQPQPKKSAAEYFEIFDSTVNYGEFREPTEDEGGSYENSNVLIIYGVSFKLKAIGGTAHNVVVQSWAKADPVYFEIIAKDQWKYVEQTSLPPAGYFSRKEGGKFPFRVRIRSSEAEGDIIIYL